MSMKTIRILAILMALLLVAVACAPASAPQVMPSGGEPMPLPMPAATAVPKTSEFDQGTTGRAVPPMQERMITYSASLELVVSDAQAAMDRITEIVNGLGGYVASSDAYREKEQLRGTMMVRVPANRMEEALSQLEVLAVRVQRRVISSSDVTEEYTDLGARLKNLELTEQELQELLTEAREKAQKAEDVLAIYNQLTEIRGQIEQIKGRMNYLSQLTALATITIELIPDALARPVVQPGWRPAVTLRSALRSLTGALQFLANALIWIVIFVLPVLIVILIPVILFLLILRGVFRRRARRRAGPIGVG
jgi:hypothetical protein